MQKKMQPTLQMITYPCGLKSYDDEKRLWEPASSVVYHYNKRLTTQRPLIICLSLFHSLSEIMAYISVHHTR